MSASRLRSRTLSTALAMAGLLGFAAPARADVPRAAAIDRGHVDDFVEFDEGKHEKISAHAVRLINAANGGNITITLYFFDRMEIVDALLAAARRGVRVRVVMDGWNIGKPERQTLLDASKTPELRTRLGISTCSPKRVTWEGRKVATRGCIANREALDETGQAVEEPSIMHNKFMTLSSVQTTTGTVNDVVYVSSANLDWWRGKDAPEEKAYENVVTLTSPELHAFYAEHYFDDLFYGPGTTGNNQYGDPDPDAETDNNHHSADHDVFTFPRTTDPIGGALFEAAEKCSPQATDDVIRVANFRISRPNIASVLLQARTRGCTVQVVTGDSGDNPRTTAKEYYAALGRLSGAGIQIKLCDRSMGQYSEMHEKTLMISHGPTAGLYIGSANMTLGALTHADESVLRVARTSPLWPKFDQHVNALHSYCPVWTPPADARSVIVDQG